MVDTIRVGTMLEMIAHNIAPIMFAALVIFLLLGYPVAFSLAAVGLGFFLIGVELAPLSHGTINLSWPLLQSLPERIFGVMNNETLLAIPFFTFMGLILERSGMAEDLLETIGQLFGTIRGGIAFAVVFVGALLAATTGVVAASVISMGLISLPIMLRYGYDRSLASGVIAASGTLAQIIPPSLVLIIMADQLGKSVGDMYEGAFVPGIVLTLLYASYIILITIFKPQAAPGLPLEAQTLRDHALQRTSFDVAIGSLAALLLTYVLVEKAGLPDLTAAYLPHLVNIAIWAVVLLAIMFIVMRGMVQMMTPSLFVTTAISLALAIAAMRFINVKGGADYVVLVMAMTVGIAFIFAGVNRLLRLNLLSKLAEQVIFVMVPPLGLIFLVLGTIFIGIATPTEGGAMGAAGALVLAIAKRKLSWDLTRQAAFSTAKLSAFVIFILLGARVFSLTFYGVNGHKWVEELLVALPGGVVGFLIVVNVFVFVLAFFLDFFELAFIVVPLLAPAATALGIDLIWFGVILGVNMQTSFMHPPFGFALFYLRSVAPKDPYIDKVTGRTMAPVTTGQIYMGAIPFVVIQIIMIALVITFPAMVMHYKSTAPQVDPSSVKIDVPMPQLDLPQGDLPPLNLDPPSGK